MLVGTAPRDAKETMMLVLTRKRNESICIGDGIEITVLSANGNRVRLGVTAPKDIDVTRAELIDQWFDVTPEPESQPVPA